MSREATTRTDGRGPSEVLEDIGNYLDVHEDAVVSYRRAFKRYLPYAAKAIDNRPTWERDGGQEVPRKDVVEASYLSEECLSDELEIEARDIDMALEVLHSIGEALGKDYIEYDEDWDRWDLSDVPVDDLYNLVEEVDEEVGLMFPVDLETELVEQAVRELGDSNNVSVELQDIREKFEERAGYSLNDNAMGKRLEDSDAVESGFDDSWLYVGEEG